MTVLRLQFSGAERNAIAADMHGNEGPPVLFLHGGGQTRHAWDKAVADMGAHGTRAIAVDLRGHGESDWSGSGSYGFDDYADDVIAIVRDVENRFGARPAVVGASLGGLSALLAEIFQPGLLEALVLVDITPDMDLDGVARIQGFMGEKMTEGFASPEEAAEAIGRYLPHRKKPDNLDGLAKNLRRGDDGRYRWHWDPRFLSGSKSINANSQKLMKLCHEGVSLLELPVLLVRGVLSELVNEEKAQTFVKRAPNARYVDVRDAGHMVAGDRNDAFSAAVTAFLKEFVAKDTVRHAGPGQS